MDLNKHYEEEKKSPNLTIASKTHQVWISSTSLRTETYIRTSNRPPGDFYSIFYSFLISPLCVATPTFSKSRAFVSKEAHATSFSFKQMAIFSFFESSPVFDFSVVLPPNDLIQPRVPTRAHFLFLQQPSFQEVSFLCIQNFFCRTGGHGRTISFFAF